MNKKKYEERKTNFMNKLRQKAKVPHFDYLDQVMHHVSIDDYMMAAFRLGQYGTLYPPQIIEHILLELMELHQVYHQLKEKE